MEISARALREVEFREKLRGYHPDDVDEFLERVAVAIEGLQDRLREAIERANRLEQQHAAAPPPPPPPPPAPEPDDNVKRTLALAQRTADLAVQEAREQGAQLLTEAQDEARRVLATAQQQANAIVQAGQAQVRGDVERLEAARDQAGSDYRDLAEFLDHERTRLRHALADALARLDQTIPVPAPPPSYAPLDLPPNRYVAPVAAAADPPAAPRE